MCQVQCPSESELECIERSLVLWPPRELGVLLGEVSKRSNSFREVYDKVAVKIGEADE